jgi:hypothetical protein
LPPSASGLSNFKFLEVQAAIAIVAICQFVSDRV